MIWLSWRQQRTETLLAAGLLALLAAVLVPVGFHLSSLYATDNIAACLDRKTPACQAAVASFSGHAGILRSLTAWFTLLPGLIGIALAAPLVLDLEQGTIRLAWTQSVTRDRWIATKLGMAAATALAVIAGLTLAFIWYRSPLDHVFGRFDSGSYDNEGIVPLAYVLFALGLALAIGVLWRRTAPSLVVALVGYVGTRVFVDSWLRQRLLTPKTATWPLEAHGPNLAQSWVISSGPSDRFGRPFGGGFTALEHCATVAGQNIKTLDPACLARHGAGYNHAVYQPASRFWELQGIEAAIFSGVALTLLVFAAWWLRQRAS